jgi:hypothetical protein
MNTFGGSKDKAEDNQPRVCPLLQEYEALGGLNREGNCY